MLKTLTLKNFTAFTDAEIRFCPGLNVVIGQNGTGKTHLLKAAYMMNRAWPDLMFKRRPLSKKRTVSYFEERVLDLFQPVSLENLIKRGSMGPCRLSAEVDAFLPSIQILPEQELRERLAQFPYGCLTEPLRWEISIQKNSDVRLSGTNVTLDTPIIPDTAAVNASVSKSIFLPSKEIVSLYEGLIALLDRYEIKLDATYRDLAFAMNGPELAKPPHLLQGVLAELEIELGGKLRLESNRLTFLASDGSKTEGTLMAEGFRKLATLPYLIRHGVISEKGESLFWDEPEANLNPGYILWLARVLVWLAGEGLQIIVATHSLFLLREIDMLTKRQHVPTSFAALFWADKGIAAEQSDDVEEIQHLSSLDAELNQNDRLHAWYRETPL